MGYKHAVPKPVRSGISNFINNLDEPVVALNYLLQLKPGMLADALVPIESRTVLAWLLDPILRGLNDSVGRVSRSAAEPRR